MRKHLQENPQLRRQPQREKLLGVNKNNDPPRLSGENQAANTGGTSSARWHDLIKTVPANGTKNAIEISEKLEDNPAIDDIIKFQDEMFDELYKKIPFDMEGFTRPTIWIIHPTEMGSHALAVYLQAKNVIVMSSDAIDEKSMLKSVRGFENRIGKKDYFACSTDHRSTPMHELMHWYHREYSVRRYPGKPPAVCMKNSACYMIEELMDEDMNYHKISDYAYDAYTRANFEEVIAEAYTKHLLGQENETVNEFVRRAQYEN